MQKNDGAGGPGQVVPGYTGPIPVVPGVKRKKVRGPVRVFQAPPKMRTAQEIMDGAGGPGGLSLSVNPSGISGPIGQFSGTYANSTPSSVPQSGSGSNNYGLLGTVGSKLPYLAAAAPAIAAGAQYGLQNLNRGIYDTKRFLVGDLGPDGNIPGYTTLGNTWGAQQIKNVYGGQTTPTQTGTSPSTSPTNALLDAINGKKTYVPSYMPGGSIADRLAAGAGSSTYGGATPSGGMTDPMTGGAETPGGGGESPTSAWGGLYGNIQNDALRGSIESGMGPGMFALSAMGDINKLRSLPGFEGVPDDFLPWGADLSGQLDYLRETLDREIGVNAAMDELELSMATYEDFANGGVGLQERLTDYVRRRDEFLNETTGMIEDFKGKLLNGSIDTYNPVVAKQAESYLGYLGTLQGRQNKRYVEWVNQSTSVYGQQLEANANILTQKMNMYQLKSNELKDRYASGEKIALIEYEQVYNALQGMYTTAAQMPLQQAQLEALQAETYISAAKAAQSALETTEGFDKLSPEYQKAYAFLNESILDKESGTFKDGQRNISSVLLSYADGLNDPNKAEIVLEVYKNNLGKDFSGVDIDVATQRAMAHYQGIAEFQKTWADLISKNTGYTEDQKKQALTLLSGMTTDLSKSVTTPFIDAVTNGIKSDADKSQGLKDAVEALTNPKRFFGLAKGSVPSKDEFLKKFSGRLPGQLLSSVYNSFNQYITSSEDAAAAPWMFYSGMSEKDPGIASMSNDEFVNNVMRKTYAGLSQYNPGFM